MTKEAAAKSDRVTNVQVPGEAPKGPAETSNSGAAETNQGAPAGGVGLTREPDPVDLEALRHQIRQEEREAARIELGREIQAAASVVNAPAAGSAHRAKSDYRNMYAREIDHTTLTAPVMTRDGWLCPPAPVAKK